MFLIFRTLLSVAVARLDGRIVRDLVSWHDKGRIWFLYLMLMGWVSFRGGLAGLE